jgi:hypothetical protein
MFPNNAVTKSGVVTGSDTISLEATSPNQILNVTLSGWVNAGESFTAECGRQLIAQLSNEGADDSFSGPQAHNFIQNYDCPSEYVSLGNDGGTGMFYSVTYVPGSEFTSVPGYPAILGTTTERSIDNISNVNLIIGAFVLFWIALIFIVLSLRNR